MQHALKHVGAVAMLPLFLVVKQAAAAGQRTDTTIRLADIQMGPVEIVERDQFFPLPDSDSRVFLESVTFIGDLDGNGVPEWATGDAYANDYDGLVFIGFHHSNWTFDRVANISKTNGLEPYGGTSTQPEFCGSSLAGLGDVDGDSVPDLAIVCSGYQAPAPNTDRTGRVFIIMLNPDATVKTATFVAPAGTNYPGAGGLEIPFAVHGDLLGVADIGDLNEDGTPDLVIGSRSIDGVPPLSSTYTPLGGAVHVLFLNATGHVIRNTTISNSTGLDLEPGEFETGLGERISIVGDVNNDGVVDIGMNQPQGLSDGSQEYNGLPQRRGSMRIVTLNRDGTAKSSHKYWLTQVVREHDDIAAVGDIDGDGNIEFLQGSADGGERQKGCFWVVSANSSTQDVHLFNRQSWPYYGYTSGQWSGDATGDAEVTTTDFMYRRFSLGYAIDTIRYGDSQSKIALISRSDPSSLPFSGIRGVALFEDIKPVPSASPSASPSPTPSISASPSVTPTISVTPSITPTPSRSPVAPVILPADDGNNPGPYGDDMVPPPGPGPYDDDGGFMGPPKSDDELADTELATPGVVAASVIAPIAVVSCVVAAIFVMCRRRNNDNGAPDSALQQQQQQQQQHEGGAATAAQQQQQAAADVPQSQSRSAELA